MFGQGFTCPALLASLEPLFPYGTVTPYGGPFQKPSGKRFESTGLVPGRSSLLGESRLLSFPPATEIFQFAGFASCAYGLSTRYHVFRGGFPHSDIRGSTAAHASSRLIAVCHVLHRLSTPRHPPDALRSLARSSTQPATPRPTPSQGERAARPRPKPRAYLQTSPLNAEPRATRTTRRTRTTPASCREPSSRCPTSRAQPRSETRVFPRHPARPIGPVAGTATVALPHPAAATS